MNKHLIRFVSLLLVPCLVGDALFPAGAATYKNWNAARIVDPSLPAGQILRTALQNVSFIPPQNPFTEEALSGSSLETTSVMLLKNDVAWAHRRFTHTAPWAIAGATWWGRLHADLFSGGSAVRAGKFDGQLKYLKEEHDIDLFPFRNARRADPEEAFKLAHEIAIRVAPIEETNHYLRDKLDEMIGAGLQLLRQGWKPEDIALHLLKERLKVMLDEHAGLSAEDITILAIELFEWTFPLQKTLEHFFSLPLEEAFDYLDAHEDRLFSEIVDKHAQYNDDISKLIRKGPLAITGSGPSDEPAVDGSTNLVTKLEKTAKSYVNMMNAGQTFTFEHVKRFRQNLEAAIENAYAEMFLQSEIVPEEWMDKWDQALEGNPTPHFMGLLNRELLLPFGGPYIYVPEGQDLRVEIPLGRWRWPIGGQTIWIVLNARDTESGFLANDGIISLDGQTILKPAGNPEWVAHSTWATFLEEIGHVTDWMVFEDLEQRGESILKLIEFKSDLEQYATREPSKDLKNDLTEVAAEYRSIIHAVDPLSLAVTMIDLCTVEGLPTSDPHYWAAHFMREEIIRLLKLPEQPSSDAELRELIEKQVGQQDIHDIRRRAFEAMKANLRLPRDGNDPAGRGLPIFRPGQDPAKDDEFSRIVEDIVEALGEGLSQGRLAFPERKQPKPTDSAAAPASQPASTEGAEKKSPTGVARWATYAAHLLEDERLKLRKEISLPEGVRDLGLIHQLENTIKFLITDEIPAQETNLFFAGVLDRVIKALRTSGGPLVTLSELLSVSEAYFLEMHSQEVMVNGKWVTRKEVGDAEFDRYMEDLRGLHRRMISEMTIVLQNYLLEPALEGELLAERLRKLREELWSAAYQVHHEHNLTHYADPHVSVAVVPKQPEDPAALGTSPHAERVATDYLEGMLQDLQQHLERLQNRMADPRSARAIYSDTLDEKVIALLEDMSRPEHPWDLVPELRRQYAQLLVEVILNFPYRGHPPKGQNPIPIVEIAEVNLENLLSDQSMGSLDHHAVVEKIIDHETNLDEAAMGRLRSGQAIVVSSLPSLETLESIQRSMGNRELTFSVVQPTQISHPLLILSNDDSYFSYPRLANYASTIGHTHGYLLPLSPSPQDKSSGRQYAKTIGGQEFILGFSKGQWIEMLWRSPEQNAWHKITDRRLISAKLQEVGVLQKSLKAKHFSISKSLALWLLMIGIAVLGLQGKPAYAQRALPQAVIPSEVTAQGLDTSLLARMMGPYFMLGDGEFKVLNSSRAGQQRGHSADWIFQRAIPGKNWNSLFVRVKANCTRCTTPVKVQFLTSKGFLPGMEDHSYVVTPGDNDILIKVLPSPNPWLKRKPPQLRGIHVYSHEINPNRVNFEIENVFVVKTEPTNLSQQDYHAPINPIHRVSVQGQQDKVLEASHLQFMFQTDHQPLGRIQLLFSAPNNQRIVLNMLRPEGGPDKKWTYDLTYAPTLPTLKATVQQSTDDPDTYTLQVDLNPWRQFLLDQGLRISDWESIEARTFAPDHHTLVDATLTVHLLPHLQGASRNANPGQLYLEHAA